MIAERIDALARDPLRLRRRYLVLGDEI